MASKILCIEDSRAIQKIVESTLTQAGYDVTLANNGIEGMEKLEEGDFDLVIIDLIMPKMNGFRVLREMSYRKKLSNLPTIVLSSDKRDQCIQEAKRLGVDHFVTKPFKEEHLTSVVFQTLQINSDMATGIHCLKYRPTSDFHL